MLHLVGLNWADAAAAWHHLWTRGTTPIFIFITWHAPSRFEGTQLSHASGLNCKGGKRCEREELSERNIKGSVQRSVPSTEIPVPVWRDWTIRIRHAITSSRARKTESKTSNVNQDADLDVTEFYDGEEDKQVEVHGGVIDKQ
ncbi:hypothetical protein BBP40_007953 [Aspergillus hancockii]|nr:hypothetical protein BBP40_007953 [Aspergillus hancockii]